MPVTNKTAPTQPPSFDSPRWLAIGALLLLALIFVAYHNSFNGPFIFDDVESIPQNMSIRHLDTAFSPPSQNGITVSGRPVLNASFALNHALTGPKPTGFHYGNLLIHAFAALTLWAVVRHTLRSPLLAWFVAALWAVHPLQTESVTYIVQRAESLVGLFYLLTLYGFIRYSSSRSFPWFLFTCSACLLGMGTKEVMATAPFIIIFYDRTFISGSFRTAWHRHGKLHLCLASTLILLAWFVTAERGRGGSVGLNETVTWWGYVGTQAVALPRYLLLTVWPAQLTLDYGTLIETNYAIVVPCGLAMIGALTATILALVRRPLLGFPSLWFFAILAPSSSVIPVVTQTIAEHRMYLPLAALITGFVLLVHRWLGRYFWLPLVLLTLSATAFTIQRNADYQTELTIWADVVAKRPDNHRAWNNLGAFQLHKAKSPQQAAIAFQRALALSPDYPEAHNNLGQALIKLGQREDGLALVERSMRLAPGKTNLEAGCGSALMDCELYVQALPHLEKALAFAPNDPAAHFNLANALVKLNRAAEAEQHYLTALTESPDEIDALTNYGTLLRNLGRVDEAVNQFKHALRVDPTSAEAHNDLGIALLMLGRDTDGLQHLRDAIRLNPKPFETRLNLTRALAQTGHTAEAVIECEKLVREKPGAELFNNLGMLHGQLGQLDKAIGAFQTALQLDPNNVNAQENYARVRAFLDANSSR